MKLWSQNMMLSNGNITCIITGAMINEMSVLRSQTKDTLHRQRSPEMHGRIFPLSMYNNLL